MQAAEDLWCLASSMLDGLPVGSSGGSLGVRDRHGHIDPRFHDRNGVGANVDCLPAPNQVRGADRAPGRRNAPVRAVAENDLRLIAVVDLHAEVRVVGVAVEQRPTLLPHLEPAAGIDLDAQVVLGVWVPR
jgi:hypothetical protein